MQNRYVPKPKLGWPLLPLPDSNGQLAYPTLEESVRQSIRVILCTRPGEQLMHPRFGAGLDRYLSEPNDLTTRKRIHDLITGSLQRWEPRILLDRVEVSQPADQPSHIRIELFYRLKRTGAQQQLGLTMKSEV